MTWLKAEAPPATRPVPSSRPQTRSNAQCLAVRHGVSGQRGRDDQQVQPRLCERDEIPRDRAGAGLSATASDLMSARCVQSVSTRGRPVASSLPAA